MDFFHLINSIYLGSMDCMSFSKSAEIAWKEENKILSSIDNNLLIESHNFVYSQTSPGGSCQVLQVPWQPLDQGLQLQGLQKVLLQSETLDNSNQNPHSETT